MLGMLPLFTVLVDCYIILLGVWLDSFFLVASMLGFICQVVRGFRTLAPCFEHVCAGGGECSKCRFSGSC